MPAAQIAFDFGFGQHGSSAAPISPAAAASPAPAIGRFGFLRGARGASAPSLPERAPAAPTPRPTLITPAPQRTPELAQAPVPSNGRDAARDGARLHLEHELRALLVRPLRLTITDNRRTMISLRKQTDGGSRRPFGATQGLTEIRLHHMFLLADHAIVEALAAYIGHSDRDASLVLGRFIESQREHIRRRQTRELALSSLSTQGVHHDLLAIYAEVNAQHFQCSDDVRISWARQAHKQPRRSRRSIKLGSYCSRERLIRVHPALDAAFVPRFFLEYIVYHELLHHVIPSMTRGGRRVLHGREFRMREQAYPRYAEAMAWEREHVDRLLRAGTRPASARSTGASSRR